MTLARRDVWVFDLDNTLYPADHTIYHAIGDRMTAYIARHVGVDAAEALRLRELYFDAYGATVAGLVRHHGVDAADFLEFVHDTPLDGVEPDPALAPLIAALPGRRIVFTNGASGYAARILARLGLAPLFERAVALDDVGLVPKPERRAFEALISLCGFDPARAVMIEDHARNLQPAHALGFATVLVGPEAQTAPWIDYAAPDVATFLQGHDPHQIDRPARTP